ncbi:MAG: YlbF family regulator [Symbiobacteriia bacterium]
MPVNPYDAAHNLARALRESDEYQHFADLRKQAETEPGTKEMLDDFHRRQFELQAAQLMGREPDKEALEQAQRLAETLNQHPRAAAYFQAEMRLAQLLADVQKIIGEAVEVE